jgi:hypothetical protein
MNNMYMYHYSGADLHPGLPGLQPRSEFAAH